MRSLVFRKSKSGSGADQRGWIDAIMRSQAVIEFSVDGTIVTANENFLAATGYSLDEIAGRHHRIFVAPDYAGSTEYAAFWKKLSTGEFSAGEYRRFGKGGREIWLQATYNPVFDRNGRVKRVIKFASDITAQKNRAADHAAHVAAISRAQAIISFELDGTIIEANENFLSAVGYGSEEIAGRHHGMFVDDDYRASPEYRAFWERLRAGEVISAEFKRLGKGGKEVWIMASYNPVLDAAGRPVKVVKFATDITERKRAEAIIDHLRSSLARMADGDLDGRIDTHFTGAYEELRVAFNQSLGRISDIVLQLQTTSGSLKTATGEILSGANDLSERTTKQAAAIEETSATMEQLASTVSTNARTAAEALDKSRLAAALTDKGSEVMGEATKAMDRIISSSGKISNIIGMIDDIAFQTNLLALNASVEAARAGDAGKGFAVVAVEVRRLAQSAAQASSDVKTLIDRSSDEVGGGSKLVAQATETLADIRTAVTGNAELMQGISEASSAQAGSIAEVLAAVRQLDEMTQHNAALVEQTNATIVQTEEQAKALDMIVEVFKLKSAPHETERKAARTPDAGGRAKAARGAYLVQGNAALDKDWEEF